SCVKSSTAKGNGLVGPLDRGRIFPAWAGRAHMFEAAHKILPPVDYVSMIRSLYADRRSMLLGAFGSALAAAVAALEANSAILGVIAGLFVLNGVMRNVDMRAFDRVELADDD